MEKTTKIKSNLNLTEFQNKLTEITKIGNPRFKYSYGLLSIFIFNSKYFFGNFENSSFELTINSNFAPHIYMIVGKYECIDKELVINYKLESISKFHENWFKYFPFIIFI